LRSRPLVALSTVAVSAFLLAGCTGSGTEAAPTPSSSATVDLCAAGAESGAATEAVTVDGEVGEESTATFEAPLEIEDLQSTVLTEGSGEAAEAGDLVTYALSAYSAETGELLGSFGYGENTVLPQQISADNPLGQLLGCAAPGTRVVGAFPATADAPGEVYVVDMLEIVPDAAWGEPQDPAEGLPAVDLAEDGAPTVTLPDGDAPTEFDKATLKKGDGEVVEAGDGVMVQYHGVSWDTGEVFDESWGKTPFTFSTGGGVVQGFSDAVIGETVGSQVIAVLPPDVAYGEGEINDSDLTGQTLVFVIDILGTQPAA
jgi:hypothetical protein